MVVIYTVTDIKASGVKILDNMIGMPEIYMNIQQIFGFMMADITAKWLIFVFNYSFLYRVYNCVLTSLDAIVDC